MRRIYRCEKGWRGYVITFVGIWSLSARTCKKLVKVVQVYTPDPENKAVYDRNYEVFKKIYKANKKNFT